jgi:biotin synthase-like enzyme
MKKELIKLIQELKKQTQEEPYELNNVNETLECTAQDLFELEMQSYQNALEYVAHILNNITQGKTYEESIKLYNERRCGD